MCLNEISYGLAFHPHFATDPPSPPYDSAANLEAIRHMVSGVPYYSLDLLWVSFVGWLASGGLLQLTDKSC